jgi:AraC-like DNA-binding protein
MDVDGMKPWDQPTVAVSLLRPFANLCAHCSTFACSDAETLALSDDDARISLRDVNAWLERLAARQPIVGLSALRYLTRGMGGMVELGAASAPTLGEGLSFLSRYAHVLNSAADFQLWVDGDVASFELRSRVLQPRALRDYQLGMMFAALRTWLGPDFPCQVWFSQPEPQQSAAYRAYFGAPAVRFDAPCDALVFRASVLQEPLRSSDGPLHSVLRNCAQRLVHEEREESPLVPRIRELLFDRLSDGDVDIASICAHFRLSRRTLTRYLAREGTNFRQLLEDVRHQRALRYLETTHLDVARIARLLGYTEPTSFCRAFIRWRGQSPLDYRRRFASQIAAHVQPAALS